MSFTDDIDKLLKDETPEVRVFTSAGANIAAELILKEMVTWCNEPSEISPEIPRGVTSLAPALRDYIKSYIEGAK